ncbi:MAG: bacterioferritin [Candidatus Omnitrophota bacterium]|jgi:bacterioferritin|nr:MAG: bacterioferritin [Candidatus Omnitrophota bacterium]
MGKEAKKIVNLDLKDLLNELNKAYADEWLAHYAYLYLARTVTGAGYEDMAEMLEETAKQEAEHAEELANRILELGGTFIASISDLEKNANYPYPKLSKATDDYDAIIKTVTDAEAGAIDVYNRIALKTQGKDHVTYQLVCHILSEEAQHEEKFEDLK